MTFFQRFYLAIGAVLALTILVAAYLLDLPEGTPRLVAFLIAVAVFGFICWLGNRKQS